MAVRTYEPSAIRNVALVGHGSCGKTSLGEAMLFLTGATNRLGSTMAQTSLLDFEPEEHKRGGSNATSIAWIEHDERKINLIDTPGDGNFIYDALAALKGADAALVVVSCPDGVEVQTERVYLTAEQWGLPRAIVLNKMDRERADAAAAIEDIKASLGVEPVPLQVPIGSESGFRGVVSLFQRKALVYEADGSGRFRREEIPDELQGAVDEAWEKLVEAVASSDDELLEKYLETFELSDEEVRRGFAKAMLEGRIVPLLYTAATSNIGVHALLDLVAWAFPSPLDRPLPDLVDAEGNPVELADGAFLAQVIHTFIDEFSGKLSIFRVLAGEVPGDGLVRNTSRGADERLGALYNLRGNHRDAVDRGVRGDILAVAKLKVTRTGDTLAAGADDAIVPPLEYPPPMMSYTISATSQGDEDKLKTAIERLIEEDPTLSTGYDELTNQLVLHGMGQAHLDMAVEKLRRKFKVSVTTDLPAVPYRETLARPVKHVEGKHKKQTGGAGQFGVCYIDVEPLPLGSGIEFVDKIFGGAIPRQFIPSVEKGIRARMARGFLAGYPATDVRITLVDGKYHPVDSKDVAFQLAGSKGIKAAFDKGGAKLLEPFYRMEITVPTEVMGDVMGDITARRGRVLGMDTGPRKTVITAVAPLAEIQRYAPDLRAMSAGKGTYTMAFEGYEPLPSHLVDQVIASSPFRKDEDDEG